MESASSPHVTSGTSRRTRSTTSPRMTRRISRPNQALTGASAQAVVVEANTHDATFVFGRTAEVLDEGSGTVHSWTIVGPTEADADQGKLSAESPVAKALLGRAPGDAVEVETPGGPRRYRVERLIS